LAGWSYSSDGEKAQRLVEHIEWAGENGALPHASAFLRKLREKDWHHEGE
jgi:hypothetical protein